MGVPELLAEKREWGERNGEWAEPSQPVTRRKLGRPERTLACCRPRPCRAHGGRDTGSGASGRPGSSPGPIDEVDRASVVTAPKAFDSRARNEPGALAITMFKSIGRQTWPRSCHPRTGVLFPHEEPLDQKLTASRHLAQMANDDQPEALVRSHAKGDGNGLSRTRPSGG